MDNHNQHEILLGVKQFQQPLPKRNPGGDCFACSLKAAVDYLYPDKPLDFNTSWEAFLVPSYSGGKDGASEKKVLSNCWRTMAWTAPHALDDYNIEVHRDIVMPLPDLDNWSYSWGFRVHEQEWAKRLEAWLSAGWVAIAECSLDPTPAVTEKGRINHTDHFVVLDGQRSFWQESSVVSGASSLEHETHVVCSARGSKWFKTWDLINLHGVNALVLLRKRDYPRRAHTP